MRLRVVAILVSLSLGSLSASASTKDLHRKQTRIAPQELARALQTLARDRNVQLVYRSDLVNDRHTPGASGVLTLDEALTQLLRGSGLAYRYLSDDAITLVLEE
jgi:hypothetical protein